MTGDKGNRVWEEIRRAMGRLVHHAPVHEISPRSAFQAVVKRSEATKPLTATAGTHEDSWRPQTETLLWSAPGPEAGGDGADLASVATVISANGALAADLQRVQNPAWQVESAGFSATWTLREAVLTPPGVAAPPVRFAEAAVTSARMVITRGAVRLVAVPRLALEKTRGKEREPFWALRRPRSRSDLRMLARVPMIRERLAPPPGQSLDEAFAAARQQLASAAKIVESDVVLVGLFPQVPLNMVQKLSVTASGGTRLQIWLKPEALKEGPGRVKPATIILGRQRSTGRILQGVARTPARRVEGA